MALGDPLQLLTIVALLVMLLLFGPKKIPEMARALGKAKQEFDAASKEFQQVTGGLQNPTALLDRLAQTEPTPTTGEASPSGPAQTAPTGGMPPQASTANDMQSVSTPAPQPVPKTGDELLVETAKALGIVTEGKTKEEIAAAIVDKSKPAQAPTQESKPAQAPIQDA